MQFVSVGNICSTRKYFSNTELCFNGYNEKVLSGEECSSNITVITQPAETQVRSIRVLAVLLPGVFPQQKPVSGQGPQLVLAPRPPFLPEICPSLSVPDRNMTVKGILERKRS